MRPGLYRLGDGEDGVMVVGASDRLLRYAPSSFYRGYRIAYEPPPIPDRRFDFEFWHVDYGGPGDPRCGRARSVEEAKSEIDMLYEDDADEPDERVTMIVERDLKATIELGKGNGNGS